MRCLICHLDGVPLNVKTCPGCGAMLATVMRDCLPGGTLLHGGRYRLDYPLGRGGFGVTYRGVHAHLAHVVAVKEFFPQEHAHREEPRGSVVVPAPKQGEFEKGLRRFLEEGRILAEISHPGVVRVLDLFEENGTAYLVMELAGSRTLRQEIQDAGGAALPEDRIRDLVGSLVEALDALHAAGVCHLDLKPENVLLTPEGRPVLVDFGSARYHYVTETKNRSTTPYTEAYAAPELVAGKGVGPATDLYELGVLLHELLTGDLPPGAMERLLDRGGLWYPGVDSDPWRGLLASALKLWPEERPKSVRDWWERSTTERIGWLSAWLAGRTRPALTAGLTAESPPYIVGAQRSSDCAVEPVSPMVRSRSLQEVLDGWIGCVFSLVCVVLLVYILLIIIAAAI